MTVIHAANRALADRKPANVAYAATAIWTGVLHLDLGLAAWQVATWLEPDIKFWAAFVVWGYADAEHAARIIANRAGQMAEAAKWRDLPDVQPVRHVRCQARVWIADAVADLENHYDHVYTLMVQTADRILGHGLLFASSAVADIARNAEPRVPPLYVSEALKEAAKRHRIRYFVARKRASGRG